MALTRAAPDFRRPGSARAAPLGDRFMSRTPIRLCAAGSGRIRIVRGDSTTTVAVAGVEDDDDELGPLADGDGVPIALADRLVVVLHLIAPEDVELAAGDDLGMCAT